ncbi:MAG: neuraminidase-like domain-containing protein [Hellea sp.]
MRIQIAVSLNTDQGQSLPIPEGGKLVLKANVNDRDRQKTIRLNDKGAFDGQWAALDKAKDQRALKASASLIHPDFPQPRDQKFVLVKIKGSWTGKIEFISDVIERPKLSPIPGQCREREQTIKIAGLIRIPESVLCRCGTPEGLCVSIHQRGPGMDKPIAEFPVNPDGMFEGDLPIKAAGAVKLQAVLHECSGAMPAPSPGPLPKPSPAALTLASGNKEEIARSEIQCDIRDQAFFDVAMPDPLASIPVFESFHSLLAAQERLPEPGSEDFQMMACGCVGNEIDLTRYIAARDMMDKLKEAAKYCAGRYAVLKAQSFRDADEKALFTDRINILQALDGVSTLPAAIFALTPIGSEPDLSDILALSRADIQSQLNGAVTNKVIAAFPATGPASLPKVIEVLVAIRDCLHFNALEDGRAPDGKIIWMLDTKFGTATGLFDTALEAGDLMAARDSWGLSADETERLDMLLKLDDAFENYTPVLWASLSKIAGIDYLNLTDPENTVGRISQAADFSAAVSDLAIMRGEDWRAPVLGKLQDLDFTGHPERFQQGERLLDYGHVIAANLGDLYPAAVTLTDAGFAGQHGIAKILGDNPDFDPASQTAESFFGKGGLSAEEMLDMQQFQRVLALSPAGSARWRIISALYMNGFTSANAIIRVGKLKFFAAMNGLPEVLIDLIYCRAKRIGDFTAMVAVNAKRFSNAPTNENQSLINAGGSAGMKLPTFDVLFGGHDQCGCGHCQSVHSPSAYLFNMLHWMRSDVEGAFGELGIRRPDIAGLDLTCANSHTVMPYIDIANEAMSLELLDTTPFPDSLNTTQSAKALEAQPEHRFKAAEDTLRTGFFPLCFPYDHSMAEADIALKAIDRSLAQALSVLAPIDRAEWTAMQSWGYASAVFGTYQTGEFSLLTTDQTGFANFWTKGTGVNSAPVNVAQMLQAFDIGFDQLEILLRLPYVAMAEGEPGFGYTGAKFVLPGCDYSDATLEQLMPDGSVAPLVMTEAIAQRILSLLRLEAKSGRSIERLEPMMAQTLRIAGEAESNNLRKHRLYLLATLFELEGHYRFSAEQALDMFENLARTGLSRIGALPAVASLLGEKTSDLEDACAYFKIWPISPDLLDDAAGNIIQLKRLGENLANFLRVWAVIKPYKGHFASLDLSGPWPADISVWTTAKMQELRAAIDEFYIDPNPNLNDPVPQFISATAVEGDIKSQIFDAADIAFGDILPTGTSEQIYDQIYGGDNPERADDWMDIFLDPNFTADNSATNYEATLSGAKGDNFESFAKDVIQGFWFGQLQDIFDLDAPINADVKTLADNNPDLVFSSDFPMILAEVLGLARNSGVTTDIWLGGYSEVLNSSPLPPSLGGYQVYWDKASLLYSGQSALHNLVQAEAMERLCRDTGTTLSDVWETVYPDFLDLRMTQWQDIDPGAIDKDYAYSMCQGIREIYEDSDKVREALVSGQNTIRKKLRDALAAKLIKKAPQRIKNRRATVDFGDMDEIYAFLLLDPGMQPCTLTSRLKLSISSVQQLMHRAMLGLEPNIVPDAQDVAEFGWRKNYRLWEANVKVFLYPENWVDPTLRLRKTPLFEEAESALNQGALGQETAEKAIEGYLTGLEDIARLDIRAVYRDDEGEDDIIHVIARDWNPPYTHHYRCREEGVWGDWEKLEMDIESDHVILTKFNRRMWIFWPLFTEKRHDDVRVTVNGEEMGAPYLEVRMAYSKRLNGRFQGKKVLDKVLDAGPYAGPGTSLNTPYKLGAGKGSFYRPGHNPAFKPWDWIWRSGRRPYDSDGPLRMEPYPAERYLNGLTLTNIGRDGNGYEDYSRVNMDAKSFYFWAGIEPDIEDAAGIIHKRGGLTIHVRRDYHPDWESHHLAYTEMAYEDSFRIDACDGGAVLVPARELAAEPWSGKRFLARPKMTLPLAQRMSQGLDRPGDESGSGVYVKRFRRHRDASLQILARSPSHYVLTYPQKRDAMWDEPFFMNDAQHVHFFERKDGCVIRQNEKVEQIGLPPRGDIIVRKARHHRRESQYEVSLHEHPFACLMLSAFNQKGIAGLYSLDGDNGDEFNRQLRNQNYFGADYNPRSGRFTGELPTLDFDFDRGGAYQRYNWEIFFHLPMLIARQFKADGNHAEALKYLQLIFDPTNRDLHLGDRRVWQAKPFFTQDASNSFGHLQDLLSGATSTVSDQKLRDQFEAQIEAWRKYPFEPHRIAENRLQAYMLRCFMDYIEILTDWADDLFRRDSIESINEAQNLYVMASELLGKKPDIVEVNRQVAPKSFADLIDPAQDDAGMLGYENQVITLPHRDQCGQLVCPGATGASLFAASYFCVPQNKMILEYWDLIEDRLFKIRHCRNIEGDIRQLALFEPPIDPGAIVRARAAGMSLADIVKQAGQKGLPYRFNVLLQKAQDFTGEVKGLGGQLLSALEKQDAEELSLIRQVQEINIQKATRNLKLMSISEAKENLKAQKFSLKRAQISLADYQARKKFNAFDDTQIKKMKQSEVLTTGMQALKAFAGIMHLLEADFGFPCNSKKIAPGKPAEVLAQVPAVLANVASFQGTMAGMNSGAARRKEDWNLQIKTGLQTINELNRQIAASEIRLMTAEKDLQIFDQQVENSQTNYDYMRSKFTNKQLYSWMAGQLKTFHRQAFELAINMARQAQLAYKRELGEDAGIIRADQWDSSRAGLLAGESLSLQLKTLDEKYLRQKASLNEYELSRSVSLRRLDPAKLWKLKTDTKSEVIFKLPEWLFQENYSGKSLKAMRLKSVAVSLPCTVGPNVKIPLKLRLDRSEIRWQGGDAPVSYTGPEAKEIITSTAANDAGRFEPSLNSAQYQPFENAGVISTWGVELPTNLEFDPSTITDLILHIRYTARPHSEERPELVDPPIAPPGKFPLSLRHDLRGEWLDLVKAIRDGNVPDEDTITQFTPTTIGHAIPYIYSNGPIEFESFSVYYVDSNGVLAEQFDFSDLTEEGGEIGLELGGEFFPVKDIILYYKVPDPEEP